LRGLRNATKSNEFQPYSAYILYGKVGTKMFQFVVLSRTFGLELDLTFGNRSPAWTDRVVRDEKMSFSVVD